jgi:hypothetical protein
MSSDDEKYDDDVATPRMLEQLARRRAGAFSDFFIGDRTLDYYLGFLRALQVSRQTSKRKPIEADERHQELVAITARAALHQLNRFEPIDWNEANVPSDLHKPFARAWSEIRRCLTAECPAAAIAMCGRLLELVLWRLVEEEAPEQLAEARKADWGLNALNNKVASRRIPELKLVVETIIKYRNASVHGRIDYSIELEDAQDVAAKLRKVVMSAWRPRPSRTRTRNTTQRNA